ncbi:hypothetical protein AAF712_010710 [Marasmius tenuissimus]|uniref:Uncharacterized protein n=1 Tax=Marasmius tenuissimus TaxID=585030 RepID=A0ABR2ZN14_9AGAR
MVLQGRKRREASAKWIQDAIANGPAPGERPIHPPRCILHGPNEFHDSELELKCGSVDRFVCKVPGCFVEFVLPKVRKMRQAPDDADTIQEPLDQDNDLEDLLTFQDPGDHQVKKEVKFSIKEEDDFDAEQDLQFVPSSQSSSLSLEDDGIEFLSISLSPSSSTVPTSSPTKASSPAVQSKGKSRQTSRGESRFQPAAAAPMHLNKGNVRLNPLFRMSVATSRKLIDSELAERVDQDYLTENHHAVHPAEDPASCEVLGPYRLDRYHQSLGVQGLIWENLYSSLTGDAVRALCSLLGAPEEAIFALHHQDVSCNACGSHFSLDGYNGHVVSGKCGSVLGEQSIQKKDISPNAVESIPQRTYPRDFDIETHPGARQAFRFSLRSPVAAAFLEWNSIMGVPADVWAVISTAYKVCETCNLARIFPEHKRHCDHAGVCMDPGQEEGTILH